MNYTILSPVIIVSAAAIMVVLERLYPYRKSQRLLREGFWNDILMYSLVQNYVLSLIISAIIVFIHSHSGVAERRLLADVPVWVQVIIFLVTHDLYIYWFHRWQHTSRHLWRIHEAHHSTKDVDWLSGSRSHALEILINQTVEFLPIILLGASPEVPLIKGMISAVWGMYIHSNINVQMGALQYVFNGPEMHRWHHSAYVPHGSTNYATKFAIWDWLFGTALYPREGKPDAYGIAEIEFPKNYFRQHLFAFRPFRTDPTFNPAMVASRDKEIDGN